MSSPVGPYLSTREVAAYLDIHEKQVYKLLQRGVLPGTRVTGKWLFPKELVDRWLTSSAMEVVDEDARPLVLAAEADRLVDELLGAVTASGRLAARLTASMDEGLRHLARGAVHLGVVEFTRDGCRWPWPPQLAALGPCALVHLGRREIVVGWVGRRAVRGLGDLEGRRVAVRGAGAATRTLLDHRVLREGGDPSRLQLVQCASHLDAALAVVRGEAELAVLPHDEAQRAGLDGWPLAELDVELVVPERVADWRSVQALTGLLAAPAWRSQAERLAGVDARGSGGITQISTEAR